MKGKRWPESNIDLGLAIIAARSEPGQQHTCQEIAAYCGCTRQYISLIEHKAMRKIRAALYRDKPLEAALKHRNLKTNFRP